MVRYRTETYTANKSYSSHRNLSVEESNGIAASNFNKIPDELQVEINQTHYLLVLYDAYGDFIPSVEAYENPGKIWSHNKKSDWYTHVETGVKVKREVVKTPDYDKPNGSSTTTLTVKIPIPSERGKNPNSHNNRAIPGLISKDVRLTEEQWQTVESLGNGKGYSQGVRNLLTALGVK